MPGFTQDEVDRCPHCGTILRRPPDCCEAMRAEYRKEWNETLLESPTDDEEAFDEDFHQRTGDYE